MEKQEWFKMSNGGKPVYRLRRCDNIMSVPSKRQSTGIKPYITRKKSYSALSIWARCR